MDLASSKFKGQRAKLKEEDLYNLAIELFQENLEKFRMLYPVKTICMHGSPLSAFDNKSLWKKYNYRDFGIIGEPYFDLDFTKLLYITDTGRRWDGGKMSVRDKVQSDVESGTWNPESETRNLRLSFHSTFDIISAANSGLLPDQIMFTFHPQRWTDKPVPWIRELVLQRAKNVIKRLIVKTSGR
jgi:hypothetical protein